MSFLPRFRLSLMASGLFAVSLLIIGCGGDKGGKPKTGANVSGTVTYKGKPLPMGRVHMITDGGEQQSGPIVDGKYTVEEAPLGTVKVTVLTQFLKDEYRENSEIVKMDPSAISGGGEDVENIEYTKKRLAQISAMMKSGLMPPDNRYEEPGSTQFTTTVNKGNQTYNIELK